MGTFSKAIIREIGRNVGKGISNDLFGDWHATPVRASISQSNKMGFDISLVDTSEYDISDQPFFQAYKIWECIFYPIFATILILPLPVLYFEIINLLLKSKTELYARVPARRRDGRTKTGYRDQGYYFIKLKSKRLLTPDERSGSKKNALIFLIMHLLFILTLWVFFG